MLAITTTDMKKRDQLRQPQRDYRGEGALKAKFQKGLGCRGWVKVLLF